MLIRLGADRILTSGGAVNVWDGRKQLKHLQNQYGKDITILAGSGVNAYQCESTYRIHGYYAGAQLVWLMGVVMLTAAGNAVDFSLLMKR